jgi:hypothetical protein
MSQIDPLLPFKIGPVNGRQAGESGLRQTNQTVFFSMVASTDVV